MIQHRCEGCGLESEVPDRMACQGIQCVRCGKFWTLGGKGLSKKAMLAVFVAAALVLVVGLLLHYSK